MSSKSLKRKLSSKSEISVDPLCHVATSTYLFKENNRYWDCLLNQTNIQNNNNKFYIIQLLKDKDKEKYYVWMRWGRVGLNGQSKLHEFLSDIETAKDCFQAKFFDKTKNDWNKLKQFKKIVGKYDLVKNYFSDDVVKTNRIKLEDSSSEIESNLHPKLQQLILLISSLEEMTATAQELHFDVTQLPLGKLTKVQINKGFTALKKIDSLLSQNIVGRELIEATNNYYTKIPHCFGMKTPPVIRTTLQLKNEIKLLELLGGIEIALSLFSSELTETKCHPIDQKYLSLKCKIVPLEKDSPTLKAIEQALLTTHGKTHNLYTLAVDELFQYVSDKKFKDEGNSIYLWHGSRLTNMASILGQGLRIAPLEAPVTGYMFGKGIYFADISSKSANYCYPTKSKDCGILLLCQVSLGNINQLEDADYEAAKLPPGKHSVLGLGKIVPSGHLILPDGLKVACGPNIEPAERGNLALMYNEYVVYDTKQVAIKYLVKVKFNYVK